MGEKEGKRCTDMCRARSDHLAAALHTYGKQIKGENTRGSIPMRNDDDDDIAPFL